MRPRTKDAHLPRRVYVVHGSYWFRPLNAKVVRLTRVEDGLAAMHSALSQAMRNLESPQDSVAALVKEWKTKHLALHKIGEDTRKTYGRIADSLAESLGQFQLEQVDTPAIQEFLDFWSDRPRMVNTVRSVCRQVFSWAVERGRMKYDPTAKSKKKTLANRTVYIPDDALAEVLKAMERTEGGHKDTHNGLMNRAFIELCYLTGQRAKDIRMLRWEEIKGDSFRIRPSKTAGSSGLAVEFVITPEIKRVLDDIKAFVAKRNAELLERAEEQERKRVHGRKARPVRAPVESEYIIHRLDGKPFQQTGLRTAWRRAIALTRYKNSGYTIKDIRPKSLTDTEEETGDLTEVQAMAAHTSIAQTEKYMRKRRTPTVVSPLVVPKPTKTT